MGFDEAVGGDRVGVRAAAVPRWKPGEALTGRGVHDNVGFATADCGCGAGWALRLLGVDRDLLTSCLGLRRFGSAGGWVAERWSGACGCDTGLVGSGVGAVVGPLIDAAGTVAALRRTGRELLGLEYLGGVGGLLSGSEVRFRLRIVSGLDGEVARGVVVGE